jgi:hypothetical protein
MHLSLDFPSSNSSQYCNMSSHGIVHYKVNKFSKLGRLAHLSSLLFILIHYSIFWVSFVLDIVFFLISFSTCSSTSTLPFFFIMTLVLDHRHWGITLQISYSSKRSQRNFFPMFLLSSYCNSMGLNMLKCLENIIPNMFLCSFWNKIPYNGIWDVFIWKFEIAILLCATNTSQKCVNVSKHMNISGIMMV